MRWMHNVVIATFSTFDDVDDTKTTIVIITSELVYSEM